MRKHLGLRLPSVALSPVVHGYLLFGSVLADM